MLWLGVSGLCGPQKRCSADLEVARVHTIRRPRLLDPSDTFRSARIVALIIGGALIWLFFRASWGWWGVFLLLLPGALFVYLGLDGDMTPQPGAREARARSKGAEASVASIEQRQNPEYEQHLKREFGFDYGQDGWGFEGGTVIDDMVAQFSEPDICLGVLKGIREKLPFSQVCIFFNPKVVLLVCNTKPTPTCFVTGLQASGVAGFVAAATKEGGKVEVHDNGPWVLTL